MKILVVVEDAVGLLARHGDWHPLRDLASVVPLEWFGLELHNDWQEQRFVWLFDDHVEEECSVL
jgi:hypothetical protein